MNNVIDIVVNWLSNVFNFLFSIFDSFSYLLPLLLVFSLIFMFIGKLLSPLIGSVGRSDSAKKKNNEVDE